MLIRFIALLLCSSWVWATGNDDGSSVQTELHVDSKSILEAVPVNSPAELKSVNEAMGEVKPSWLHHNIHWFMNLTPSDFTKLIVKIGHTQGTVYSCHCMPRSSLGQPILSRAFSSLQILKQAVSDKTATMALVNKAERLINQAIASHPREQSLVESVCVTS